jgi:hypothetical protein
MSCLLQYFFDLIFPFFNIDSFFSYSFFLGGVMIDIISEYILGDMVVNMIVA